VLVLAVAAGVMNVSSLLERGGGGGDDTMYLTYNLYHVITVF
jgi:hypothetical protein